jgi:hydroxymethylglutaryl-CoA lyase
MRETAAAAVEIIEVSPRDGLQNEATRLSTAQKLELLQRLTGAGLRRIEAVSFVSPTRVPQMADAEAVLAGAPPVPGCTLVGLVLNQRGFERARAAGCHEINVSLMASDTFNRRNQGAPSETTAVDWHAIARAAAEVGMRATLTIGAAFGCPFEGEVPVRSVVQIAGLACAEPPAELALADTIGVATPVDVKERFAAVAEALPGLTLRAHFHNTRNTGIANAYAALEVGVRLLDASLGGIGGCPFAPRATGNIATEDLAYMLHRMGLATGLDLDRLAAAATWLEAALGHPVPGLYAKAGPFPPGQACALAGS